MYKEETKTNKHQYSLSSVQVQDSQGSPNGTKRLWRKDSWNRWAL